MTGSNAALLLRDFINTRNVESGADQLDSPAALAHWLAERGLAAPGARAEEPDLVLAHALREGLRALLLSHLGTHQAVTPRDRAGLDDALATLPLRVSVNADAPVLIPLGAGTPAGLGALAAAIMRVTGEGGLRRLKVCQEDTCRWAFVDTSKNRSRTWCSMKICGNRTKTRAYRARQADRTSSAGGA